MAVMDATAILTAVRDVLDDAAGDLRTITAATYDGGAYEGQDEDTISRESIDRPNFNIVWRTQERHSLSPPTNGSVGLWRIALDVIVYRHIAHAERLTPATRDAAMGLAATDGDRIAQALEWPGNLAQDNGANATGLIGEALIHDSSEFRRFQLDDTGPGIVETVHRFHGFVQVAQAVS